MPLYRIFIANYLVKGETFTELPGGRSIRNKTSLKLGGFHWDILRTAASFDLQVAQARGHFNYTTDLLVHDVRPEQRARVDALIDEVTELLSFATMSQVVRFGHEYGIERSRQSVNRITLHFRPTLGPAHGKEIREFLESTWRTYHRLRKKRKLNIVIDSLLSG